jgi:oligoribonuclease NrnB/cAMP/cGMP phosphodiesterase (DHH superfamily)
VLERKVFHLSHTDLDGYSCQMITSRVYTDIEFFNSGYGQEIDERLSYIVESVKNNDLVLITDLNLDLTQSKYIDEKSKEIGFELLLLDHHKSGKECADRYSWYNLDVKRSATKITYDYFKSKVDMEDLDYYVECVNAYDIWLQEKTEEFELGKVLARYVMESREINRIMFSKENFKYISFMLKNSMKYVDSEEANIKLDDLLHSIKKSFFMKSKNNTLENLVSEYVVELLTLNKDNMTVIFEGKKGLLTYSVGNTSIIGNAFLRKNPDYDFFLDINSRKNISARANNRYDVAEMARKLFGGGGHANASGGRFLEFKDSFIYENIKTQIQNLMESC